MKPKDMVPLGKLEVEFEMGFTSVREGPTVPSVLVTLKVIV